MEPQPLNLKDIHLPDAITWWPPAIGWWLLLVLIPVSCMAIIWLYKFITRKTAIKTAKKQLIAIKKDTSTQDSQKLQQLSELLRRVAISIAPRSEAASLTGQAWLHYLDQTVKGTPFTEGVGQYLADAHYRKSFDTTVNIPQVITLCDHWIKAQKIKK
jgi:hypothetical protein